MQERLPVELEKSYRLLNHGPTVLVSSSHGGRHNVMAAAWSMPLDFSPPKVTVVIDDPYNVSNGASLPILDAPTIVLWPTPPEPSDDIGQDRKSVV